MAFAKYPPINISEAITVFKQDVELAHGIVHGDENTEVLTENGLVPSFKNVINTFEVQGQQVISEFGWDQVGTFTAGFTFTSPNQVGQDADGNWWRWNGAFNKVVTAGTLPISDANYKLVGDGVLRSDLAEENSEAVINGVEARTLTDINTATRYGAVYDGTTDNTVEEAAYEAALLAKNPDRSKRGARVGLPVNSRFDLGQVAIWQGSGGVWGTGNNDNLSIGQNSLGKNTTGYSVTVYGYEAGEDNTTGFNLTAVGRSAGRKNTTGINNSYFGTVSGNSNTTGSGNTAGGVSSLTSNVAGNNNTAFGFKASFATTGNRTTSVGVSANELGTADDVCVFGYEAGQVGQAIGSCLFGRGAGINGTGSYNAGFGYQTQFATGNGGGNTSLGAFTLQGVANQSNNTAIGYQALQNNTVSGNTALGFNAGNSVTSESNVTCIGANSAVTGSNQVQLGDSATTVYAYGAVQNRSDARDKLDAKALTDAHIAFFMDIEWKQYLFNYRENYFEKESYEDGEGLKFRVVEKENDGSRAGKRYHIGAIAQQVEAAMKKHGIDFAGLQHHAVSGGQDVYSIGYQEFIGIQGEIIQRQQRQLNNIEDRLQKAGL